MKKQAGVSSIKTLVRKYSDGKTRQSAKLFSVSVCFVFGEQKIRKDYALYARNLRGAWKQAKDHFRDFYGKADSRKDSCCDCVTGFSFFGCQIALEIESVKETTPVEFLKGSLVA